MKLGKYPSQIRRDRAFSALGRAVWDETVFESYVYASIQTFSALGRAVWDETMAA